MKHRYFVLGVIVLVVLAAASAYWMVHPPALAPAMVAAQPVSAPASTPPPPEVKAPRVAQPTAAPVPVEPSSSAPPAQPLAAAAPVAPAMTSAEARVNVDTAVADAARLLETNDLVTLFQQYMPPDELNRLPPGLTPEQIAQQFAQRMAQNPKMAEQLAISATALKAAQGMTPVMSDNDNTATYNTLAADGTTHMVVLKKQAGLWYIQDM